ncbi:MAG: hypothetical protein ACM3S4_06910 [Burkholderiales bacterium]
MKTSDKVISAKILGLFAPVIISLLLWWGGVLLHQDIEGVFIILIAAGIAAGIILDVTALRKFLLRLYDLPLWALFIIEGFYSIIIYGVFMGFPVPCSLAGIFGSYIVLRRGIVGCSPKSAIKSDFAMADLFSFILLLVLCVCTAVLSLNEPTLGSQLKSMLGLSFSVDMWMIWLLIFAGGAFLLAFQHFGSRLVARAMLKKEKAA